MAAAESRSGKIATVSSSLKKRGKIGVVSWIITQQFSLCNGLGWLLRCFLPFLLFACTTPLQVLGPLLWSHAILIILNLFEFKKKKTLIIHRMSLVEWVLLCHHRADKGEFFWLFFFPQASPLQVLRLLLCSHTADQWDFENYEFVWFKNILSTTWPYESDVVSLAVSSLSWLIWLFLKDVFKQTCVTTIDGTDNSDSLLCVYCGMTRCDMTHGDMTSCDMTRALFHDSWMCQ